jgi:hypothetical protein
VPYLKQGNGFLTVILAIAVADGTGLKTPPPTFMLKLRVMGYTLLTAVFEALKPVITLKLKVVPAPVPKVYEPGVIILPTLGLINDIS